MIRICTEQLHFCLQRHTVCQSALQTLLNGVTWRINEVIQELECEVITRVCYREVFIEHLIQTILLAFLRWRVQLEEVTERLQLHVKEIRIWHRILYTCEVNSVFCFLGCHACKSKYDTLFFYSF